ncbi:MAG: UDP-2,3-diacylglucosamine diphosphatase [Patescibacteria group bacterium]|nr:UDP-2,3-diacylglucosamine diphosphatase [Patescibacteria group bacterium]MDE1971347.1 UDP-2,3-diacylglucosamine diphosphatase [Patescibacteria group bacterium]
MPKQTKVDTLILSDLHLGAPTSKPKKISALLNHLKFKRLILLGDIFDSSDFTRLEPDHLSLLSLIKSLSRKGVEIIWIRGNHDDIHEVAKFIGSPLREEYMWDHGGKRFLAIHGDQFDDFPQELSKIDRLAHLIFLRIQRIDKRGRHLVKLIDYANARIRRLSAKVARGAIRHALNRDANYVFCGHTHLTMRQQHENGDSSVEYVNTGCWTHTPSTFAVVGEDSGVSIEKFK